MRGFTTDHAEGDGFPVGPATFYNRYFFKFLAHGVSWEETMSKHFICLLLLIIHNTYCVPWRR